MIQRVIGKPEGEWVTSHIAKNPRNTGRKYGLSEILKKKRSIIERFNSRFKEMLQGCWRGFKGLVKKETIVHSAPNAMSAIALQALILGDTNSMRRVNLYRN